MYEAWDVVALWRELLPPISHRPFPLEILLALVALAAELAWVDVAVLMLIGFVGCLRKSEILNLRWSDLITMANQFCVSLPDPCLIIKHYHEILLGGDSEKGVLVQEVDPKGAEHSCGP